MGAVPPAPRARAAKDAHAGLNGGAEGVEHFHTRGVVPFSGRRGGANGAREAGRGGRPAPAGALARRLPRAADGTRERVWRSVPVDRDLIERTPTCIAAGERRGRPAEASPRAAPRRTSGW